MGASVLTAGFSRVDGTLHCDGVPLDALAGRVGTPSYVYSAQSIREQYGRLSEAFASTRHRLHYSLVRETQEDVDPATIVRRGQALREKLEGKGTPPETRPATRPKTGPTTR